MIVTINLDSSLKLSLSLKSDLKVLQMWKKECRTKYFENKVEDILKTFHNWIVHAEFTT